MEDVLNWGLEVVRSIQGIANPALTFTMKALTQMGSEYFYLLALPILFWCVDERFGIRFALVILFSTFVNAWLKSALAQPRPYDLDPGVALSRETTYGFPSNHAQGSAVFWGLLAPVIRRPWGLLLAVAIPLAVGFTRLYLGVHFPTDVVGGWLLGWGVALSWLLLGKRVQAFLAASGMRGQVLISAVAALGMNALLMEETHLSGVFFGSSVGAAFMFGKIRFDASQGSPLLKAARFGLGALGLALVYFGGKLVSPRDGEALYALARFVRYGLVGAWVTLGAPWLFIRLGLGKARITE